MILPVIASPSAAFDLIEGRSFSYQLKIDQGSLPIEWTIIGIPIGGIVLDSKSGRLTWENPVASSALLHIQIQATNELTRSYPSDLTFHVSPSYYVQVSSATVLYKRPSQVVYFDCFAVDMLTGSPVGGVLAVVWVQEQGMAPVHRRKVTIKTNSFGTFRASYQPYSTDAGVFLFGGEHPMYTNLTVQGQIEIGGIDVIPNYFYFKGFPSELQSVSDAFHLHFRGGTFSGIKATFGQDSNFSIIPSLNVTTADPTSFSVALSLNISSLAVFQGPVYFNLSTNEGLQVSSSFVYMDVRYRAAKLVLTNQRIDVNVKMGTAMYYDVILQNVGSLACKSIEVIFDTYGVIHPVSDYIPALEVDESAIVSLRVLIPFETNIGTVFTGVISFVSNNAETAVLEYRVTSISSFSTNLTIVTQNEASFFSIGQPNLDDVDVTVTSLTGGATVFTGNSGMNGSITITGLVEDFYKVIARKPRHKTFTRNVVLKVPGQTVRAFLSFEPVSYTFYVVPIPVVDKYKIIVESTFTTCK